MARQSKIEIEGLDVDVYEPEGASPKAKIVLVHGAWVGGWVWSAGFAGYLADAGYSCYAPTLRGRYNSRPVADLGRVSVRDFVQDVLAVAQTAGADVLLGESAGGLFAQKAAEAYRPKALVLMNSAPPFMVPVTPKVAIAQVRYLPDLIFKRPNKPSAEVYKKLILNNVPEPEASEFYGKICAESGLSLLEMSLGKIKVDPAKIQCPVYAAIGHLDAIIPVKAHRRVAALYRADVAEYPAMSHHTFSEVGWEKVAAALVEWLDAKLG